MVKLGLLIREGGNSLFLINGSLLVVLGIIVFVVIKGISIIKRKRNQVKVHWVREIILFLFTFYLLMVVSVTLFPLPIGFQYQNEDFFQSINIVPLISVFEDIKQIGTAYDGDTLFMISLIIRNVGGNILLLMPLGFLAPLIWNKFKSVKAVSLLGMSVSVTIEILQLFQRFSGGWGRITDIDDVIFNVLGVIIGYLIYIVILKTSEKFEIKVLKDLSI